MSTDGMRSSGLLPGGMIQKNNATVRLFSGFVPFRGQSFSRCSCWATIALTGNGFSVLSTCAEFFVYHATPLHSPDGPSTSPSPHAILLLPASKSKAIGSTQQITECNTHHLQRPAQPIHRSSIGRAGTGNLEPKDEANAKTILAAEPSDRLNHFPIQTPKHLKPNFPPIGGNRSGFSDLAATSEAYSRNSLSETYSLPATWSATMVPDSVKPLRRIRGHDESQPRNT
jgi:hypothetical protein